MSLDQIQSFANLPFQALLVIAVIALWRAYNAAQIAHLADIKENYEKNLADLRTRVHLLEDNASLPHPDAQKSSATGVLTKFPVKDPKLD